MFHWGVVAAFAVAYVTGDEWRAFHIAAGYTAALLIVVRLWWGFNGPTYARFSNFITGPAMALHHLRDAIARRDQRYIGHNPAGVLMIVALLVCLIAVTVTGVLLTTDAYWGSETMDAIHGWLSTLTLGLVAIHVAGVVATSLRHRENLIWSMITGWKRGE